jgi:hypothetical protein
MPTPTDKATAYLSKLEADRIAAVALSKEKELEAMLINARAEGFREAMEIFSSKVFTKISYNGIKEETDEGQRRRRRDIRQMIINELMYTGKVMTTKNIARAIDYIPERTEVALKRLERAGKIVQNKDGQWEAVFIAAPRPNGHDVDANYQTSDRE